jgi:hypothetical protein
LRSLIKNPSFLENVVGIERIPIRHIAAHVLRRAYQEIQPKSTIQKQLLDAPPDLPIRLIGIVHDEKVNIAVGTGLTPRMRSKMNNLLRIDRLYDGPSQVPDSIVLSSRLFAHGRRFYE